MNGIDKIAARILSDAEKEAAAARAEAERKAAELRRAADADAKALRDRLTAEGEAEAEKRYQLLLASGETGDKKQALTLKQALVAKAFTQAVALLAAQDEDKYIALLASLAAKASETGSEQIYLNKADRARLGDRVVQAANKLCKGSLTLAEGDRPIVGGLILSQGSIEVNCALDTLAELRKNELAGQAARLLFD